MEPAAATTEHMRPNGGGKVHPAGQSEEGGPYGAVVQRKPKSVPRCGNLWIGRISHRIVTNKWFDRFIIFLILANCGFLAVADPLDTDPQSTLNRVLEVSDMTFLVIFSVEMVLKLIAFGICGKGAYLWDPWNCIDGFLVVGGWLTYLPWLQESNLSSVRVVRVLRPLRTINSIEGLKILIDSLLSALPQLLNVLGLCAFIFFLFGLVGLQVFPGKLNQRCFMPANATQIVSGAPQPFLPTWDRLCHEDPAERFGCPVINGTQLLCLVSEVSPNNGITNFDNIGTSFLAIFQMITLEGWVDIMYWIEETTSVWTNLYFILLITFGSLFLLNLIIAAMTINLSVERSLAAKQAQVSEWSRLATGGRTISKTAETPNTAADVIAATVAATYDQQVQQLAAEEHAKAQNAVKINMATSRSVSSSKKQKQAAGKYSTASPTPAAPEPTQHALHAMHPEKVAIPMMPSQREESKSIPAPMQRAESARRIGPRRLAPLDATAGASSPSILQGVGSPAVLAKLPPLSRPQPPLGQDQGTATGRVDVETKSPAPDNDDGQALALADQNDAVARSPGAHSDEGWIHPYAPGPDSHQWRVWCFDLVCHHYFTNIVMGLILLNTLFLAIEHHNMEDWLVQVTSIANIVLTILFSLEMFVKIVGLTVKGYFSEGFNRFDCVVVLGSWVELVLAITGGGGGSAVSALRTFRLLRVFKLAQSWESFNELLNTTVRSLPRIGPFSVVLIIFMFIFSLLGMQLMGGKLGTGPDRPRANYDTFLWAFTTTFQVLSGENWNEVMYTAVGAIGWPAALFFVGNVVFGSYIVLNLFLAILIDNFCNGEDEDEENGEPSSADVSNGDDATQNKDDVAVVVEPKQATEAEEPTSGDDGDGNSDADSDLEVSPALQALEAAEMAQHRRRGSLLHDGAIPPLHRSKGSGSNRLTSCVDRLVSGMRSCCCHHVTRRYRKLEAFKHRSFGMRGKHPIRYLCGIIVTHPIFDTCIMLLIIGSCVMLALDTPTQDSATKQLLADIDVYVTILFTVEMVLKLVTLGVYFHPGAYFRDAWNCLDAFIVIISLGDWLLDSGVKAIKVVRFLRALRPLRMVRRLEGLRLVLNAVVGAIPNCVHVAMVAMLFFLIFGILGVNFFAGKFYSCSDPSRKCNPELASDCPASLACTGQWDPTGHGQMVPREWINPSYGGISSYSFDNIGAAVLTLFEVASLELWLDVMHSAADVTRVGWAPERDANQLSVFFFMMFIMLSSFFILNLFVSVVAENFSKMKYKMDNKAMFMTESQRRWADLQRDLANKKPAKLHAPPASAWKMRMHVFEVVNSQRFELAVLALIMLNVLLMACTVRGQAQWWTDVQDIVNLLFGLAFFLEAALKLTGLGLKQYFSSYWNIFDFTIVTINVTAFVIEHVAGAVAGVDFTLLRVIRVVRIFRLVKVSPHLRAIFTTLLMSLPSLGNVGALLFMLFFMYAVAGQQLFGAVESGVFINEHANFHNFRHSMLLLFRMSTGESWNGLMHDCVNAAGSLVSFAYFVSFVVLGQFVMLNLFVAVILENFEYEMEAESDTRKVKRADLDLFATAWSEVHMEVVDLMKREERIARKKAKKKHREKMKKLGVRARAQSILSRARLPVMQTGRFSGVYRTAGSSQKLDRQWLPAERVRDVFVRLSPPLGIKKADMANNPEAIFKVLLTLEIPISTSGQVGYTQTLHALALRACGEELPDELDNHQLLNRRLDKLAPKMTIFNTAQLFGALLVQRWVRKNPKYSFARRLAAERESRAGNTRSLRGMSDAELGVDRQVVVDGPGKSFSVGPQTQRQVATEEKQVAQADDERKLGPLDGADAEGSTSLTPAPSVPIAAETMPQQDPGRSKVQGAGTGATTELVSQAGVTGNTNDTMAMSDPDVAGDASSSLPVLGSPAAAVITATGSPDSGRARPLSQASGSPLTQLSPLNAAAGRLPALAPVQRSNLASRPVLGPVVGRSVSSRLLQAGVFVAADTDAVQAAVGAGARIGRADTTSDNPFGVPS